MPVTTIAIPAAINIDSILKIFFIIGLSVYSVFALVVVRQIEIMSETVNLTFELPIKILGIVHLIFAVSLLIFAFTL